MTEKKCNAVQMSERSILKVFLLGYLHKLFREIFQQKINLTQHNSLQESYTMDSRMIQLLIEGIIETGEYTIEGIAYHTRVPLDVIYDAASGISNHFSITPWARVADLYMQVKPEVTQMLIDRLLEIKNKNDAAFSLLLKEV
jgi:hypothetical protein